jgi:DNA-binding GntR family transcriptional regulator
LNVSRTPVREALKRLAQEGLIEETGKGAVVLGVSPKDLADIYEIRIRVEGLATAMCAEALTDEMLQKLTETVELQEFYTVKGQVDSIKRLDSEFHRLIYSYCQSKVLCTLLSDLHRKVQRFRRASVTDPDRALAAVAEHRRILDALRARDRALADQLAVEHIQNALASIRRSPASDQN